MSGISKDNPYVGPRPFTKGETLYGRAVEVQELFNLLQARRIVVLHSPSGAGKSSLVQAGLIPRLEQARFDVWCTIRVSLNPRGLQGVPEDTNRYLLSALVSMEEELPEEHRRTPAQLAELDFGSYMKSRPRRKSKANKSVVLLFDQFEEVLTADPLAVHQKRAFFDDLGRGLDEAGCWALFIVREDFLAALAPYRDRLPTQMANTFRLDLLGLEGATEAVVEPARKGGRSFPAADKLIRDLSTVQEQQADGSFEARQGVHVEPVQMQVVCRRLWEAMPDDDLSIDEDNLRAFADVSQALDIYYSDAVKRAAGDEQATERAIREWVGQRLITGGIRAQVRQEAGSSGGLDNALIDVLRSAYVVRAEQRAGALWFELSHDRMVEPVQLDNEAWREQHLVPL